MREVVRRALPHAGIDVGRFAAAVKGAPRFVRDYRTYRAMGGRLDAADLFPVLGDRGDESGAASGHYFHQDLWAARRIYERRPERHYDIGSRIDGFVATVSVFQPVSVIDVRPMTTTVPNVEFVQSDATSLDLPDRSVDSISTLHAVEHFGLGRYGDPLDPEAWRRAVAELVRVAAPGGRVYFSTPIGRERTMFNAHRVFAPSTILDAFSELDLVGFAAVDDDGDYVPDADPGRFAGADYACGLFEFGRESNGMPRHQRDTPFQNPNP